MLEVWLFNVMLSVPPCTLFLQNLDGGGRATLLLVRGVVGLSIFFYNMEVDHSFQYLTERRQGAILGLVHVHHLMDGRQFA